MSNHIGKGNKAVVGINKVKRDGEESRDEGADRDVTSNAFSNTQSFDSRSCSRSIFEKEVQADLGEDMMGNLNFNAGQGNNVSQSVNDNVSMNVNDEIGPILVPVSKNPLLSSRYVLENGIWLVDGLPLFVQKWEAGMNPIIMDRITTEMCKRSYGRASFARVFVKANAEVGLSEKIEVWYKSLGGNNDGGGKTVNYMRYGSNKGGNGGMYRYRNNYGKGSSNKGGFGDKGRGGNIKVDEGRSSKDPFAINGMASKKINIDERVIYKKKNGKNGGMENVNVSCESNRDNAIKGVGFQNMFSALSDEVEIEKRLEWESMKEWINDAYEKGLRINIEEKINWSEDLWDYFKISHSSRIIAKESKTKTEAMVKSMMIKKGLTEYQATRKVYEEVYIDEQDRIMEMIIKKYAEAYENMVSQIGMGNSKDMNDEEWVSNNTDSYKGCRIAVGWDPLVVSATLLSQSDPAMHLSVRYLLDNKLMYVSIVYGKMTPKSSENSNRLNVRSEGTNDFKECVDCLGVADFNMNELFYTWIQKAGKKTYVYEEHIRDLNRKNGDVFDKVNFLRTELGRVQECLDRDPSNDALREEEIGYAFTFKDAALDEEKLLQQKTKITWLKDGDFNSSYFHKLVNERMSRNRFEVVYDDKGNPCHRDEIANNFVSHFMYFHGISFYIDDNKASGPDGHSYKFFKAAWSVVGPDSCSATNEFFVKGKLLGEFNKTLISLVTKVISPARVIDYRPISCCNVVYKVISKVLTNRLKLVLNDLVDVNYSSFILGRQSSDNIMLAQEFMRNYTWGNMARNCAFKVDIHKAYDTVSWSFLEFCIRKFRFHPIMVNWIMTCLTTASFSLCIIGESHGSFKAKRGLRQGDSISPYLFTLVMEVLNLMIKRHVKKDSRLLLISSVLASLQVYWGSLFIFPMNVCEKIDKFLKNFLWARGDSSKSMEGRFDEVLDVPMPNIVHDLDDKTTDVINAFGVWNLPISLVGGLGYGMVIRCLIVMTRGFLCISLDECLKERYVKWCYMDVLSKCLYGPRFVYLTLVVEIYYRRDGNPILGSNMDYFSLDIHGLMQSLVLFIAGLGAFQDKQDQSLCQRLLLWYKYEVLGNLSRSCSLFSLLGVFPIGFYMAVFCLLLRLVYGDGSWSAGWS
nr:hypothetical protein [Tanacetum cinerariifolium]